MKTGITDDRLVKMRRPRVIKILALLLSIMPVLTLSAQAPEPVLQPARPSTPPNYLIQPNADFAHDLCLEGTDTVGQGTGVTGRPDLILASSRI